MEIVGIALLGLAIGSFLGWVSFFRVRRLEQTIRLLERRVKNAGDKEQRTSQPGQTAALTNHPLADLPPSETNPDTVTPDAPEDASPLQHDNAPAPDKWQAEPPARTQEPTFIDTFLQSLRMHWMVWLGGACVGLSGVFLARYGIEQGLLGPAARIALGIIAGIILHGTAEWLRRREGQSNPSFAALAGSASIVLYASLLAALHLYQLMTPTLAFLLMAAIALLTMLLALLHGPMMAILGLLGAYVVPVFVSDNSGNVLSAMLYALIISAAGLLLMRYVYRPWLWFGVVVGAIAWWLLSLPGTQADGYRGWYLAALTYAFFAIPVFDWWLKKLPAGNDPGYEPLLPLQKIKWQPAQLTLALLAIAHMVSIAHESFTANAFAYWSPFIAVVFLASRAKPTLCALPWIVMVAQWAAWLYSGIDFSHQEVRFTGLTTATQTQFMAFAGLMAVLFSGMAGWILLHRNFSHWLASLMLLAPPLWLALAYLLVSDLSAQWQWGAAALVLGSVYLCVANARLRTNNRDNYSIWLILGGHLTYSIATAMLFREATLSLALALQLVSLAWLKQRFNLESLAWLIKAVIALVLLRLTFNPWLLQYSADTHWSLWTYGGATACCMIAALLTPKTAMLRQWLEAATLQLLVLFLATEARYWLYGGDIFSAQYTLTEAAINTAMWASLGLVYYYRSRFSTQLTALYYFASRVLLAMACANYFISITALNPLWSSETVAQTPIWNLLLGAYGLPVFAAYACARFYHPHYRATAMAAFAILGFIFINMEIRHLWQGDMDISQTTLSGELYTYSVVWLLLAVGSILLATAYKADRAYQAGMALLMMVIVKVFLIDMSDLQGLLRAVSFMGLGLALLGLAYVHQRVGNKMAAA